jgi:hypothetical protein
MAPIPFKVLINAQAPDDKYAGTTIKILHRTLLYRPNYPRRLAHYLHYKIYAKLDHLPFTQLDTRENTGTVQLQTVRAHILISEQTLQQFGASPGANLI